MAGYAPIGQASFSSTPYTYSPLLSDGDDIVSRSGTVASGIGVLKRGTICKIVPATGVITVGATAAEANCILANDVDATSATVPALVYLGGKFKADAVIWPGALAHADVSDALRNFGIFIESVIFTDGSTVKSFATEQQAAGAQAVVASNKAEDEAARSAGRGRGAKEGEAPAEKPTIDSPWAYLTAEEREKNPELAEIPTAAELQDAAGGAGEPASVTLSPTSDSMAKAAETSNFTVTKTGTGTWTATSGAAWLTVVSPTTPQSASGSVTYAAAANTSGVSRNANITVNGKTFAVTQAGI